ncbi:MAG TPA: 30S ribosomal protein S1 [Bryobacteraceae bacterium]|jgi:small subunit ribosomal protein S1|nr:30S ribosomal protein S1 [Bryobacteraceae bacterium]
MAEDESQQPEENFEEYEHFLEDYSHFAPPTNDEVLQGTVLSVNAKEVIVDFGYKSEGLVPIEQFQSPSGEVTVKRGDVVDVMVDHSGPQPEGYVLLSHSRASRLRVWDQLEKAHNEQLVISGHVLGRVKGGLAVDVGIKGFMPGSQADPRPVHNLDALIGQDIPVKIIKLNRRRGNVVVSRKAAVEEEISARKGMTLEHLVEGAIVTGVVKNLTEYGAFIDLGGIDGLLHVTDISYGRITHPSETLHVGDEITVKVLKFDRSKERVSLGLKQLEPDPWETAAERYTPNSRVIGRVVNVTDYGAFVELEAGVEGLIHISEMTWSRRMKHPSKVVKPGDQVETVVLEVHPGERRISLGLKQLEPNPWTTIDDRYSVGSVVEGRVRNMTDFGAFIEIEEGIDGLVHVSDLSWTKRIKHPSEVLKKGQIVQAVILNIDSGSHRLSLGIKQLQPDAWESYFQSHHVNDVVHGRVCRLASFGGAFVELAEGVEGLCHFSEVPGYTGRRGAEAPLAVGDELNFKIIKMSEAEKKIGLSLKALAEDEEKGRLQQYGRQAASATTSIEEVMSLKDRDAE